MRIRYRLLLAAGIVALIALGAPQVARAAQVSSEVSLTVSVAAAVVAAILGTTAFLTWSPAGEELVTQLHDASDAWEEQHTNAMMEGVPIIERANGTVADIGESWWSDTLGGDAVVSNNNLTSDSGEMADMLDFNPSAHRPVGRSATPVMWGDDLDSPELESAFNGNVESTQEFSPVVPKEASTATEAAAVSQPSDDEQAAPAQPATLARLPQLGALATTAREVARKSAPVLVGAAAVALVIGIVRRLTHKSR